MWFSFSGRSNSTVTITGALIAAAPRCADCGCAPQIRANDGTLLCHSCLEVRNRLIAITQAPKWLPMLFASCTSGRRSKLYRSLASLWHPDAGGDAQLMTALNAVKEQFP